MFESLFFSLSAGLTCLGAFGVAWSKNLMHACVYLLASLFGTAGLYAVLGADFLAVTQLVVYAGGVVILMIFSVMLTGGSENKVNRFGLKKIPGMGSTGTMIAGLCSALIIGMVLVRIMASVVKGHEQGELPVLVSTVEKLGVTLITDHVLAFEISSILLLGALIGAAVIARPVRRYNG